MRILLIKTSSMGDLIHTLPALTDAGIAIPGIKFDWVVEDSFADIPAWHPLVEKVIPVALRRWRKGFFTRETRKEWRLLREQLQENQYDLILDAQGLVKSAYLTFLAKGKRVGLDWRSARESIASLAYQEKHTVNFYQHAIHRMRSLFALALGYDLPHSVPDYGLDKHTFKTTNPEQPYLVFLHSTTWTTKLWPENYWLALAKKAAEAGYQIKISGGSVEELERAKRIGSRSHNVDVLPRLTITEMAHLLASAKAAVAVDTGFGHLAAALNVPILSLYGATNPQFTGALGEASYHLAANFACAPCLQRTCHYQGATAESPACYMSLSPDYVWQTLMAHKLV